MAGASTHLRILSNSESSVIASIHFSTSESRIKGYDVLLGGYVHLSLTVKVIISFNLSLSFGFIIFTLTVKSYDKPEVLNEPFPAELFARFKVLKNFIVSSSLATYIQGIRPQRQHRSLGATSNLETRQEI